MNNVGENVGPANQKVLAAIRGGYNGCNADHCYAGVENLYTAAGNYKLESVYQGGGYVYHNKTLGSKGTVRLPVPGEAIDYRFYPKDQNGNETHADPFHSVVIYSNQGNGNYTVWDWKHDANQGLRNIHIDLNDVNAVGYLGRIYTPQ
jgi:hypothetical protein